MLHQQSFTSLRRLYGTGELSPVDVARSALDHAQRVDAATNAFALLDPERALAAATASERRWRGGAPASALDGMPVTVKDFAAVAGWPTRRGSLTTSEAPAAENTVLVDRLLKAGAVLLGKTRTPEFNWKGVTDSPGFGITRNPWNLALTPGGSSGGCAAAVSAGVVRVSFGSDAGGSVRIPAAFCGTLGLKPTFGLIPMVPQASHFSGTAHIGPLGACSTDILDALRVVGGRTPRDWTSVDAPSLSETDALSPAHLKVGLLAGKRRRDAPAITTAVEIVMRALDEGQYRVKEIDFDVQAASSVGRQFYELALNEIVRRIPEVDRCLLDPGLVETARYADTTNLSDYMNLLMQRDSFGNVLAAIFDEVDILVLPTVPIAPFPVGMNVPPGWHDPNWLSWNPYTPAFNVLQTPALSFPVWSDSDPLPVGVQFIARKGNDGQLLRLGAWLEERLPPRLRNL